MRVEPLRRKVAFDMSKSTIVQGTLTSGQGHTGIRPLRRKWRLIHCINLTAPCYRASTFSTTYLSTCLLLEWRYDHAHTDADTLTLTRSRWHAHATESYILYMVMDNKPSGHANADSYGNGYVATGNRKPGDSEGQPDTNQSVSYAMSSTYVSVNTHQESDRQATFSNFNATLTLTLTFLKRFGTSFLLLHVWEELNLKSG